MEEILSMIESSKQFNYSTGSLLFFSCFILAISFFHTLIFVGIYSIPLRPKFILTLVYAVLCILVILFCKEYMILLLIVLFLLTFVFAILGMLIVAPIINIVKSVKTQRAKGQKANVFSSLLRSLFIGCIFFGSFFLFGILGPILTIVIIGIIQKSGKGGSYSFFRTERQLPTSTIRAVAIGLAEIQGKTVKTKLQKAPYSSDMCIGYFCTEEKISYDKDNKKSYSTVFRDKNIRPFSIQDATGTIAIATDHLTMQSFPHHYQYESGDRRFTQYLIEDQMHVLLIGQAYWHDTQTMMMREDEHSRLFHIIPVATLEFRKKMRPILQYLGGFLVIWLLSAVVIINTPMHIVNNKLEIGKTTFFDWKDNFQDIKNLYQEIINDNEETNTMEQLPQSETWYEDVTLPPGDAEGVEITSEPVKSEP